MDLRIEQLIEICTRCHGKKIVVVTHQNDTHVGPKSSIEEVSCPTCKGRGVMLSPTGQALLEFIKTIKKYELVDL